LTLRFEHLDFGPACGRLGPLSSNCTFI
jgi:hypothetical protein